MLDVNDSIVSLNNVQDSLLLVRSLVELRSTARGGYGRHLLLHEQLVDLSDVLVKEVGISDELLELKDTVQEATGNLTSHLSVDVLDGEVDSVTNELDFLIAILNLIELSKVNFGEADLLDGSLALLLDRSLLLSGHSLEGVVVDDGLLGSLTSALSTLTVVLATASSTLTVSSTVLTLVLATTASTLVVSSSGVVSVLSLSLVHVTVLLLHATDALHHVLLFGSLVLTVSEPVEHLSLFAGVLLVLELLLGYPEVNRDGSVAEGGTLVKALDSVFGMINIFVKNESLFV